MSQDIPSQNNGDVFHFPIGKVNDVSGDFGSVGSAGDIARGVQEVQLFAGESNFDPLHFFRKLSAVAFQPLPGDLHDTTHIELDCAELLSADRERSQIIILIKLTPILTEAAVVE